MNTSWHSYPKIYALGHRYLKDLLLDEVIVEEKVDGSQISFGIFGGELKIRSRSKEMVIDAPEKMFNAGVDAIKSISDKLHDGWTYRGEYLSKPKHNALAYNRIPDNHIIIFDINTGEECYVSYEEKKKEAESIGFEVVPLLYKGKLQDAELFNQLLDTDSILGGQKVEGVVIKNYNRFGLDGKALMGKYVSEKYKEVHSKEWGKSNPSGRDIITRIIMKLKTEARWDKAIQHIKERGELTDSPKDIGALIKEVQSDTIEECNDIIIGMLLSYALPSVRRGITAGLPEWYKEKLMNKQFKTEENNAKNN